MKRLLIISALPVLALAACGQGNRGNAGDITTTNTGDVVLNDAQANYAFRGDNETATNDAIPANDAMPMGNDTAGNSTAGNTTAQ
jgi:hypothetical protein